MATNMRLPLDEGASEGSRDWVVVDGVLNLPDGISIDGTGFSKYEILHPIGRGAHAEVRLVRNKETNEHFAMKSVNLVFGNLVSSRQLAVKLAASRFRLSHVLRLFEVYYTRDGYLRLIFEVAEYGGFERILKLLPYRRLRGDHLRKFAEHTARGLAQLHAEGLLHRDIKPANLVLMHDGIIKITDFGVASMLVEPPPRLVSDPLLICPLKE